MKGATAFTNLLSGLTFVGVVVLLTGYKAIQLTGFNEMIREDTPELKTIVLAVVLLIALTNMVGLPKRAVHEQWECSGFGDLFWPTERLTCTQKRTLAGSLELTGILLTLGGKSVAPLGYALIMCMYARGSMCNLQTGCVGPAFFTGLIAAMSCFLMLADMQPEDIIMTNPRVENTA